MRADYSNGNAGANCRLRGLVHGNLHKGNAGAQKAFRPPSAGNKAEMRNVFRLLFILAALLFLCPAPAAYLYAQEDESSEPDVEVLSSDPELNRIDMDIRTSTLSELAAWCRGIGLSEGGTSADLAKRLRDYFRITEKVQSQTDGKQKIITIESARSTDYFKIETVDEEYARLSGEVKVSLKDGDAIHRIRAWNILFNRTRNILTASGGVEYIKEEGDKIETFRGESITVDLDNWSSIFLGGVSERSLQNDNTTYLFAGTVISRDEEEVTILNKAAISNANNPESLWSLNASQVWLLPGSDFAIFNAVLKVGEIPVLYIPFFYYPADEVIFHPVIGFRTREGNFVQTTTYILGRPKATSSSQSSLTKILGNSSDMEKKREGMFLRSTGKKATDPNTTSLVAMVDYYANLGAYLGANLNLPSKGIFDASSFSLGIGLTRTIVPQGRSYTPFYPTYDGDTDWNHSNLFSMDVPFRYRFQGSSSIKGNLGSVTWSIPFYSDPLVDSDFLNRSEEMDWINMIQKGAAMESEDTSQNYLGSYAWQFSGQVNTKFPNMSPYITGITISGITSTISFKTVDKRGNSSDLVKYNSPSSFFYAPDTATLYSLSGSIAGNPLTIGGTTASQPTAKPEETPIEDPLRDFGIPRSPFESVEKSEEVKKNDPADKLVPPVLTQRFDLPRTGNVKFSVDYRFQPTSSSTLRFNSNKWKEYTDIDWSEISSIISNFGGDASTTLTLNHSENFFTNSFTYSGNGTWRQYSYLNEDAEEFLFTSGPNTGTTDPVKVSSAKMQEYKQSFFSTAYGFTSSLRPLYKNSVFGSSSLQYNLNGLAVKSNFTGTGDDPEWEMIYGEWTKEKITTHKFSANMSASVMDKIQTLSVSAELPPRDSAMSWSAGFRVWISETDASMRIQFPGEPDRRKLEPFIATERLKFGTFGSFTQNLNLDTELVEQTSLTSTLNLSQWGLTASYAASRMLGYEYIPGSAAGWVPRTGDPTLKSRDFTVSYSKNISQKDLWNNRMQFTVNTSSRLLFDLQRYTNSNFSFTLGFTINISKFLDLTMSTTSENSYIYRYFKDWSIFSDADINLPDGPQNNLFLDLLNSFRFDNEELRKESGFKMKNFRISINHYLGDWNAILNWTMSPERFGNSRQYEMNNVVSFLVQWAPISEIKSDISYNKRNTPEWSVK